MSLAYYDQCLIDTISGAASGLELTTIPLKDLGAAANALPMHLLTSMLAFK